ncbi:MAG: GNAT family N-acetyltransferase [Chlamydiota bacterium]
MFAPSLITERLLLRHWKKTDLDPFAKMNADPRVMAYFPKTLSTQETTDLVEQMDRMLKEKGYGPWAVEVPGIVPFIGFVGLMYQDFPADFTPCIEIGWRLAYDYWGQGYAFEAASKVMEYAFFELQLPELVSLTSIKNKRSQKLMQKLGMTRNPKEDFDSPKVPLDSPLQPHVIYRKKNPAA